MQGAAQCEKQRRNHRSTLGCNARADRGCCVSSRPSVPVVHKHTCLVWCRANKLQKKEAKVWQRVVCLALVCAALQHRLHANGALILRIANGALTLRIATSQKHHCKGPQVHGGQGQRW
eukprot:2974878-Rhodomonas_salina.1